jgi:glycosyltransferase involved in cell wall biosynthesis
VLVDEVEGQRHELAKDVVFRLRPLSASSPQQRTHARTRDGPRESVTVTASSSTRPDPAPPALAIISNEPTPYRLHVLKRVARELPDVKLHSLFTHTIDEPSAPWRMQIPQEINPVFFPDAALSGHNPVGPRAVALYRSVRDYLSEHRVKLAVLLGYNDLARLLLLRWASGQGRLPRLLTGDSNVFAEGHVRGVKRLLKRCVVNYAVQHSAGLMPMGTCGRAFFRLYADHDKPTFLFPYEPDYDRLQTPDPQRDKLFALKHGLDPTRKRLLYCGRLVPVKRVDVLLDAFAEIAARRPEWDVVIAGDGPLRLALEARVPASLRNRVKWTGFLQTDETIACYRNVDVLVLPSEREPWALVVNEAIACSLAVVATEVVGAAAELVDHGINGLLVPPGSVNAMSAALLELTDDNRCDAMRRCAPMMLARWRAKADPVRGLEQALIHFGVMKDSPERAALRSVSSGIGLSNRTGG